MHTYVETSFVDAEDPDGWGTVLFEEENILYHRGRLFMP